MAKREQWILRNLTKRVLLIGDLPNVPQLQAEKAVDLLKYQTKQEIEQSVNLKGLIRRGWVEIYKRKDDILGETNTGDDAQRAISLAEEDQASGGSGGSGGAWGDITGTLSNQTDLQTALDAKADTTHTHAISDITDSGTAAALNVAATGDAAAGEIVKGNDSRLTDARTPTSHTHAIADVTNLQTTLDAKASSSHTHTLSDITDSGTLAGLSAIQDGDIDSEAATNGQVLTANGAGGASWTTVSGGGGGDVTKVGTPVDNQIAVWTGDGTVEGDSGLQWSGTVLSINPLSSSARLSLKNTATGGSVFTSQLPTDTQARFRLATDGGLNWGPGGTAAQDTTLYRSAASTLKTNDGFVLGRFSSDPTAGVEDGYIYYNTTSNKFRGRVNGAWVNLQ